MSIFRLAIELFVLYLVYKVIFDFIIPIAQTTKQVKKQFGEMNERMNQQQKPFDQPKSTTQQYTATQAETIKKPVNKDYIDFEEIKD